MFAQVLDATKRLHGFVRPLVGRFIGGTSVSWSDGPSETHYSIWTKSAVVLNLRTERVNNQNNDLNETHVCLLAKLAYHF